MAGLARDYGVHPYGKWRGAFWRLLSLVELGVGAKRRARRRRGSDARLAREPAPTAPRSTSGDRRTRPALRVAGRAWRSGPAAASVSRTSAWTRSPSRSSRRSGRTAAGTATGDRRVRALVVQRDVGADPGPRRIRRAGATPRESPPRWPRVPAPPPSRLLSAQDRQAGAPASSSNSRIPPYWHYDVLVGLVTLARSVGLDDPRASDALDLVESKRQPDGTWRCERRWWKRPGSKGSSVEAVDWGDGRERAADRPRAARSAGGEDGVGLRA